MPQHAEARVVGEHPLELRRREGEPSATHTWPACSDRPMPTPPPWWKDTHVAPDAVEVSAFRTGQSAIASEPSAIDSVSR